MNGPVDHDGGVLVVVSASGGGPTATLAEAGIEVLVVEEGPCIEQGAVARFSTDWSGHA